MKKLNFLKYGLTALMMAFAMTLCFSCSSDDDEEEVPSDNPVLSLAYEYEVRLTGRDFSESIEIYKVGETISTTVLDTESHFVNVGDTLSLSVKPLSLTAQPKSVDAWDNWDMISFDKETNKVLIVKNYSDGKTNLIFKITDPSGESVSEIFPLIVRENN